MDYDLKCRICLKLSENENNLTPLVVKNEFISNLTTAEIIMECASVNISLNDCLPQKVCSSCLLKLWDSYQFKILIEKSDTILKEELYKKKNVTLEAKNVNDIKDNSSNSEDSMYSEAFRSKHENKNCHICRKKLSKLLFEQHMIEIHQLECCKIKYANYKLFIQHISNNHRQKEQNESDCNEFCEIKEESKPNYLCFFCGLTLKKNERKSHILKNHPLVCCNTIFKKFESLMKHLLVKHKNKNLDSSEKENIQKNNPISTECLFNEIETNSETLESSELVQARKENNENLIINNEKEKNKKVPTTKYTIYSLDCHFCGKKLNKKSHKKHILENHRLECCNIKFIKFASFIKHLLVKHKRNKSNNLENVEQSNENVEKLEENVENLNENSEIYEKCENIEFYQDKTNLKINKYTIYSLDCHFCGKKLNKTQHKKHVLESHPLECCNIKFNKYTSLLKHLLVKHKRTKNFDKEQRKKNFELLKNNCEKSAIIIDNKKYYKCKYCGKLYQIRYNLLQHIKNTIHQEDGSVIPKNKILCEICGVYLNNYSSIRLHLRVHSGIKPFKCPYDNCSKNFPSKFQLNNHITFRHTDTKNYKCSLCEKSFHTASNLKKHKTHVHFVELRQYNCEICAKVYTDKKNLKDHVKAAHLGITFKCDLCDREYSYRKQLTVHRKKAHDFDYPYKCDKCERGFFKESGLKSHRVLNKKCSKIYGE